MNFWIGLIFFISYIFVASILFIKEFAKNPEKQKLVFGVRNRDQFYDEKYKSTFMDIYNDNRFRTIKIICFFVITGIILLVTPNFILKFSLWLIWLSIGIVVIYIPYISGNKQLKSLKKTMEIKENKKILVDTKKVGKVIYGNKILFFLPLFVEVMCFILGMLFDSDLIKINSVYE